MSPFSWRTLAPIQKQLGLNTSFVLGQPLVDEFCGEGLQRRSCLTANDRRRSLHWLRNDWLLSVEAHLGQHTRFTFWQALVDEVGSERLQCRFSFSYKFSGWSFFSRRSCRLGGYFVHSRFSFGCSCGLCVLLRYCATRQHLGVTFHHTHKAVFFGKLSNAGLGGGGWRHCVQVAHSWVNAFLGYFGLCTLSTESSNAYVYPGRANGPSGFSSSSVQYVNQRFFGKKLVEFINPDLTCNLSRFLQTACQTFTPNCFGGFFERSLNCFFARLVLECFARHLLNQSCRRAENCVKRTGHNSDSQRRTASLFKVVDDCVGALVLGKLR